MQLGTSVQIEDHLDRITEATDRAKPRNLQQAAELVRDLARGSIRVSRRPSSPDTPPHTRAGELPAAIQIGADKETTLIGTAYSRIGTGGEPHERAGRVAGRRERFERRPFMLPALEAAAPRFAGLWIGTIRP
ncbi:MAG: hypothetical protein PHU85_11530 [Phycisphaerae bacterium]|nr:hypothetical protein [Phycisphaerae bacterium]